MHIQVLSHHGSFGPTSLARWLLWCCTLSIGSGADSGKQARTLQSSSTLNFAGTASRGFQGEWLEKTHRFSWNRQKDFLLTWDAASSEKHVNVTASDAVRANGPLTLLYVLSMCKGNGAMASFLDAVAQRKKVHLHVIGVNPSLEPAMDWDHFLVGPLTQQEHRLVDAFNLPITPFAGMNISLLFSADDRVHKGQKYAVRGHAFPRGYSESYHTGLYHLSVNQAPDLVLAINPGFALYPGTWWPTLKKLQLLRIPIVATGYSGAFGLGGASSIRAVYEHDSRMRPQIAAGKLQLPSSHCGSLRGCLQRFASEGAVKVHRLEGAPVNRGDSNSMQCGEAGPTLEANTVCSDLNGNTFLAERAGYRAVLAIQQPFAYCDSPGLEQCQSSAVVSVFEPSHTEASHHSGKVPADLVREDLHKMMACHERMHTRTQHCMADFIQEQPDEFLQKAVLMTEVLNSALSHCQHVLSRT
jgi:hypothetical protein